MAVPKALTGADGILNNVSTDGVCKYKGITVRETAAAVANFRIRVNSTSGVILESISLAANESISLWFDGPGKICSGDLYEDFGAGTYEGSIFIE